MIGFVDPLSIIQMIKWNPIFHEYLRYRYLSNSMASKGCIFLYRVVQENLVKEYS